MATRNMPLVIAHRGASGTAPENTMAAFRQAVEMGADMIELDVQRTKDGQVVVIHDATLQRTTNGSGAVRELTYAEIEQLDAGSWFGEGQEFAGERVPLLKEVLEFTKGKCALNIEIKNIPYADPGIEQAVVDLLHETGFPLEQVIISSFDHSCLHRIARLEPNVPTACLFSHYPASLAGLDTGILHPSWQVIRPEFMSWVRESGRKVNVWTVDKPERWAWLLEAGVDGIITNYPARLIAYLKEN